MKHRRRRLHARDRLGERPRRLHAAVEDGLLATRGPDAVERDGREVDDGVDALEGPVVERPGRGVPGDLVRAGLLVAHEPDDAVPGRRQVVGEVRADQAARAGDRHLEARPVGPLRVPPEVQPRALVAEAEEARERLAGRALTDGVGEPAGRQVVLDVVEQFARALVDGHEPVHVLPRGERALDLPVDELPARHGAAHLRHPAPLDGTEPDVEGDAPAGHVAALLQHLELLPRRRQPPERAGAGVVGEDLVGGRRHDAAPLEDRHRTPPWSLGRSYPGSHARLAGGSPRGIADRGTRDLDRIVIRREEGPVSNPDGADRSITAEALRRDFGQLHAVDGVDLEVPGGQIFGFLGPNGAGKSTLVKILTTILNPTERRRDGGRLRRPAAGRQGARGDRRRPPGRRPRPADDVARAAHAPERAVRDPARRGAQDRRAAARRRSASTTSTPRSEPARTPEA